MIRASRISRWLDLLHPSRPPGGVVVVASGLRYSPMVEILRQAGLDRVLAVETDPSRACEAGASMPDSWIVSEDLPAATVGTVEFHHTNLRWASGLIDPSLLVALWPGARPTGSEIRQTTTLERIIGAHGMVPNWLFIDCLPAIPILEGCPDYPKACDVIVARVITTSVAKLESCGLDRLQEKMACSGFDLIAVEQTLHPSIAHALFIRSGTVPPRDELQTFPSYAKLIAGELEALRDTAEPSPWLRNHLTILRSELGLMQVELALAESRGQLAAGAEPISEAASLDEADAMWLENLARKSKAQLQQDLWVLRMTSFKRGGFFVEFGATDGVLLSNSFLLEKEFGWRGICAEPNPESFKALARNRLCTVSPRCIGPRTGEQVEFIFAEAYGGMARDRDSDQHKDKRAAYQQTGHTAVLTTISLHDFLIEHGAPRMIDYMSIDTEGSEFSILEKFPFDYWDIRHFTIEHNFSEQRGRIRELLEGHGYIRTEAQWDDWYHKPVAQSEPKPASSDDTAP